MLRCYYVCEACTISFPSHMSVHPAAWSCCPKHFLASRCTVGTISGVVPHSAAPSVSPVLRVVSIYSGRKLFIQYIKAPMGFRAAALPCCLLSMPKMWICIPFRFSSGARSRIPLHPYSGGNYLLHSVLHDKSVTAHVRQRSALNSHKKIPRQLLRGAVDHGISRDRNSSSNRLVRKKFTASSGKQPHSCLL